MDIRAAQAELQKRWQYPYRWGKKQDDSWDSATKYIYQTVEFDLLLQKLQNPLSPLCYYALNRWYNFHSAKAIEHLFTENMHAIPHPDPFHKTIDFTLHQIPFDLKTSIFPNSYPKSYNYATSNKLDLIQWLYENQSKEGRKHFANRLFLVLYNPKGAHWKLKAALDIIQLGINQYLQSFSVEKLTTIYANNQTIFSDVIFIKHSI